MIINSHGPLLYKTGDLVRYNDRMELVFVGRVDFQIKLRGQRLEVGEIEACIQSYRDEIRGIQVQQCIVQKIVDENTRNEYLCAYFTIKSEKDEQEQENSENSDMSLKRCILTHCSSKLIAYMVPSAYVKLDKFPLNSNGKVDRKQLPNPSSECRLYFY